MLTTLHDKFGAGSIKDYESHEFLKSFSSSLLPRNEQYYEAIMGIWNQLYINIKSLIAWQYCSQDINYINSLTLTMVRL